MDEQSNDQDTRLPQEAAAQGNEAREATRPECGQHNELRALVERSKDGDKDSFGQIFVLLKSKVYLHLLKYVRDSETAADLSQDVFLKAWRSISLLREAAGIERWLLMIATHAAIDYIRRRQRERQHLLTLDVEGHDYIDEHASTEKQTIDKESIRTAFANLHPRIQKMLLLSIIGYSAAEIAMFCHCKTPEVVATLLSKARTFLRKHVSAYLATRERDTKGEASVMERYQFIPCEAWEEKLALYPTDLPAEERAALAAHIATCQACAVTLADFQSINDLVYEICMDTERTAPAGDWRAPDEPEIHLPTLPARNRCYTNLPPRPEVVFGREYELRTVLEVLNCSQPLLAIEGRAGVGKTTLAIEVAYQALHILEETPVPLFDAVIWISARTNLDQKHWLSEILNTVARVLDYPSVAQLCFEEKHARISQLLRTHQTLIVIDNFDTIDDPALLNWIQRLPLLSKILITSRDVQWLPGTWTLRLTGLHSEATLDLIRFFAQKLELAVAAQSRTRELLDLVRITRGNPQAIAMMLGYIKGRGLNLSQALAGLDGPGDVLVQLFVQGWEALTSQPAARQALLALLFFAGSATGASIGAVALLEPTQQESVLARLVELSFVERYRSSEETGTRYGLHPLAHAFLMTRLNELPEWEAKARERWVDSWLAFTSMYGGLDGVQWAQKYDQLAAEWENLMLACAWCRESQRYETVRAFWSPAGLLGMTSIYGYWQERICWLAWLSQEAEKRADWTTAVEALAEQSFTLVQLGRIDTARDLFTRAWGYHRRASSQAQLVLAENIVQWRIKINDFRKAHLWLKKADHILQVSQLQGVTYQRHLLMLQYFCGIISLERQDRTRAEACFRVVLAGTQALGWQRATVYVWQFLADIARWRGEFARAETLLKEGLAITERNKDRRRTAYYKRSLAYLLLQRDRHHNLDEAIYWAQQALDDFEHLSMLTEVNRLRHLLTHLRATPPATLIEEFAFSVSELAH